MAAAESTHFGGSVMIDWRFVLAGSVLCCGCGAVSAGQLVHIGSLSGGLGQQMHVISLNQFDTQGGALTLNFVQIDVLTSVIGGGTSNGSGVPTDVFASLSVDYFLNADLLLETQATIDTQISNASMASFTLFDTDTAQLNLSSPDDIAPWIGAGLIELTAITEFLLSETPMGTVDFSAGGSAQYTVTYDFTAAPGPPSFGVVSAVLAGLVRRRRH